MKKQRHKYFAIVATQNPNKGVFEGKRQELSPEFLSRFQKIFFPDITENEMKEIALGIGKIKKYLNHDKKEDDEDYNEKKKLIKNIVKFHFQWQKKNNQNPSDNDIQCFTIREIESVIDYLSEGWDPYTVMMAVYGGRFRKDKKEELKKELDNYGIKKERENESLPKNFPDCFKNESLIQAVNMILLALKNKRNVIIVGNPESGLTYIAELCSRYFNFLKKHEDKSFICFCTKNLECSDLLGTHKLVNDTEKKSGLLKFEPRFLYEAIKNGNCVVLDSINEASSKVIERLNGLLDKKILKGEKKFEVPEESSESKIEIHKNFRIICTSNFQNIDQISPAFVNRFEVVVLENQLGDSGYNKDEIKKLIEILCNRFQKEYYNNFKNNIRKIEKNKNPLL